MSPIDTVDSNENENDTVQSMRSNNGIFTNVTSTGIAGSESGERATVDNQKHSTPASSRLSRFLDALGITRLETTATTYDGDFSRYSDVITGKFKCKLMVFLNQIIYSKTAS